MKIIDTIFQDLVIIEPEIFEDSRGYFFEAYNEFSPISKLIQDNYSMSKYGTIRGLHFQVSPHAQAKMVFVIQGKILDVAVDLRKNSNSYGKTHVIELSSNKPQIVYIPTGFAHGFSVLSETALVNYKCDKSYSPGHERGILYSSDELAIDWKVPPEERILSSKDLSLPESFSGVFL